MSFFSTSKKKKQAFPARGGKLKGPKFKAARKGVTAPGRGGAPGKPQKAGSRKVSRGKVKVPKKGPKLPVSLGGKSTKKAPPFPGAAPPLDPTAGMM